MPGKPSKIYAADGDPRPLAAVCIRAEWGAVSRTRQEGWLAAGRLVVQDLRPPVLFLFAFSTARRSTAQQRRLGCGTNPTHG